MTSLFLAMLSFHLLRDSLQIAGVSNWIANFWHESWIRYSNWILSLFHLKYGLWAEWLMLTIEIVLGYFLIKRKKTLKYIYNRLLEN